MARPKPGENDDLKRQYGIWLGLPKHARKEDEQTEEALAKKLGVSSKSMSRWKLDPIVIETEASAIKLFAGNDELEVTRIMILKAKEGSHLDRRLYYEYIGRLGSNQPKPDNRPRSIKLTWRPKHLLLGAGIKLGLKKQLPILFQMP